MEQYDSTVKMLSRPAEKETGAAAADDGDEVKISSKKRKAVAASGLNKKDKVCTVYHVQPS